MTINYPVIRKPNPFRERKSAPQKLHDPGGKVSFDLEADTIGLAKFSKCGKYRWLLVRQWDLRSKARVIIWILMNPSTADEKVNDPTIAKICRMSRAMGYNVVRIYNMFAYRVTDSKLLHKIDDPVGDENMLRIEYALRDHKGKVVCAWGRTHKRLMPYDNKLRRMLRKTGHKFHAVKINKTGGPYHPLYLPDDTKLVRFKP